MQSYQLNYASGRPQMYDKTSRINKASRIIKTLGDYIGQEKLKALTVLDVGASTGIIDFYLSKHFNHITGIDIDHKAIFYANRQFKRKNLVFKTGDALRLVFPKNKFDIIICTHVYEHVPNPGKLFEEIYRVLKPGGIVYFAAINSLWPIEPHYDLPFLSYLPKKLANIYVSLFNRAKRYYETPLNYWQLEKLTKNFSKIDYTSKILDDPVKFGYKGYPIKPIQPLIRPLSRILKFLTPTFFWMLVKNE
ncbi:class I SAM-dependent methyltransferase [Candidatus Woesebacteria bacterium]|nr:class I SAM-dependent methyltransferase [Candidatus Woesebacteria bacterium]